MDRNANKQCCQPELAKYTNNEMLKYKSANSGDMFYICSMQASIIKKVANTTQFYKFLLTYDLK